MIGAVFVSNLPEASGASAGLESSGLSRGRIYGMWLLIALATAAAATAGYLLFDNASDAVVAFTQSFAAGALLVMLSDAMLPDAVNDGGDGVGLMTVLGFALTFALAQLA